MTWTGDSVEYGLGLRRGLSTIKLNNRSAVWVIEIISIESCAEKRYDLIILCHNDQRRGHLRSDILPLAETQLLITPKSMACMTWVITWYNPADKKGLVWVTCSCTFIRNNGPRTRIRRTLLKIGVRSPCAGSNTEVSGSGYLCRSWNSPFRKSLGI